MLPAFSTRSGLTPKNIGFHSTRSASLPFSTEPTCAARPCVSAGLMVYLAMYRLIRRLSLPGFSPGRAPRCCFILSAVCQVRMITSPTRPIAWLSDEIMLKAAGTADHLLDQRVGLDGVALAEKADVYRQAAMPEPSPNVSASIR